MIRKLIVSFILVLHCSCLLIYFWRMSHDHGQVYWKEYGWTVFYDCSLMIPFMILCVVTALIKERDRCVFDTHFLLLDAIFTLSLIIGVVLQYFKLIEHTYGYQICIAGIILATFLISSSAYKHGYYR